MATLCGKASAPSAGGRDHVQPELQDKTQGEHTAFIDHDSMSMMVSVYEWFLV